MIILLYFIGLLLGVCLGYSLGCYVEKSRYINKKGYIDLYLMGRQTGKTSMLIKMSAETGKVIVAPNSDCCYYIRFLANEMKLNIPCPITFSDLVYNRHRRGYHEQYLVDELGMVLNYFHISAATLDLESVSVRRKGGWLTCRKRKR